MIVGTDIALMSRNYQSFRFRLAFFSDFFVHRTKNTSKTALWHAHNIQSALCSSFANLKSLRITVRKWYIPRSTSPILHSASIGVIAGHYQDCRAVHAWKCISGVGRCCIFSGSRTADRNFTVPVGNVSRRRAEHALHSRTLRRRSINSNSQ